MKLIIGLGNPGEKYRNNRHNVGHLVADVLLAKKTNTFMNDSGSFVKKMLISRGLTPNDLFIIHDDLDIRLGEFKIQKDKGPKLHYGIQSIEKELGTTDFWRVRVGVDNRPPSRKAMEGKDYVLQDFSQEEQEVLQNVISQICKKLATL